MTFVFGDERSSLEGVTLEQREETDVWSAERMQPQAKAGRLSVASETSRSPLTVPTPQDPVG